MAAFAPALVIRDERIGGVAVVGVRARAFAFTCGAADVAAEQQEQVGVGLQGIVDGRALGAEAAGRGGGAHVVGDGDDAAVGVGGQHLVGPRQQCLRRRGVVLEVEHHEVQAPRAEEVEVVVVVGSVMAGVILAPREMRHAEVLVVVGRGPGGRADRRLLVVAHRHAVGHAVGKLGAHGVLQAVHRIGGVIPLRDIGGSVPVVHEVAELGHIRDVARHPVRDRPFGLRDHHLLGPAVVLRRVILGVRHHHHGEIGRGALRQPPVIPDGEIGAAGLGDADLKRRGVADVDGVARGEDQRRVRGGGHTGHCPDQESQAQGSNVFHKAALELQAAGATRAVRRRRRESTHPTAESGSSMFATTHAVIRKPILHE